MPTQEQAQTDTYTFVVIGDIHDKIEKLQQIPELASAAGVIITGDITNTGRIAQARIVFEAVRHYTDTIFAQIGNMDRPEVTEYLTQQGANIHRTARPLLPELLPDVGIMGLGGSPFTPFNTPSEFPESDLAEWLEKMAREAQSFKRLILVSHTPPLESACDIIPTGAHVGSSAVKDFILEHQPEICLCGHIHEARAIDNIGHTSIMNPGTLRDGGYGLLHVKKESITLSRHEWT